MPVLSYLIHQNVFFSELPIEVFSCILSDCWMSIFWAKNNNIIQIAKSRILRFLLFCGDAILFLYSRWKWFWQLLIPKNSQCSMKYFFVSQNDSLVLEPKTTWGLQNWDEHTKTIGFTQKIKKATELSFFHCENRIYIFIKKK